MSTFKGVVAEFPDIRIDYFRAQPNTRPPLACFLSHIHSDHLQGLEGYYGGPFIYCSDATKELLIRLERRAHRINLAKQIVECHNFTHADKKKKLKTIPLETPTTIELANNKRLRVTLFDANHCPGAVMFLIEDEENSILYTGDIRAEPWWIEWLVRHPILIPYTTGLKTLSRIYLDTSFASKDEIHKDFPTKAEGIRELIWKISDYPKDTIFHINMWTFGYEDVWVAISSAFNTGIHVDGYLGKLFRSIRDKGCSRHGPYLSGFFFGNSTVEGRLTNNPGARFHSCDRQIECSGLVNQKVVYVIPVVTRLGNVELAEPGLGAGDLESHSELALDDQTLASLLNALRPFMSAEVLGLLTQANKSRREALPLATEVEDEMSFTKFVKVLSKVAGARNSKQGKPLDAQALQDAWDEKMNCIIGDNGELLPRRITYPYSRHSSYNELRDFISRFRPKDIYPCTVCETTWCKERSIQELFGDLCSGTRFEHDEEMYCQLRERRAKIINQSIAREGESYQEISQVETQSRSSDGEEKFENDLCRQIQLEASLQRTSPGGIIGTNRGQSSQKRSLEIGERIGVEVTEKAEKRLKAKQLYRPRSDSDTSDGEDLESPITVSVAAKVRPPVCSDSIMSASSAKVSKRTPSSSPVIPASLPQPVGAAVSQSFAILEKLQGSDEALPSKEETSQLLEVAESASKEKSGVLTASMMVRDNDNGANHAEEEEEEDLDLDEVENAAQATLGMNGTSWWDVGLISTGPTFRYREEKEL